jgi:hypothetical protein
MTHNISVPAWFVFVPLIAVLIDSVVVITVGLHLKGVAKTAVLEAADEIRGQLFKMFGPMLKSFGIELPNADNGTGEPGDGSTDDDTDTTRPEPRQGVDSVQPDRIPARRV